MSSIPSSLIVSDLVIIFVLSRFRVMYFMYNFGKVFLSVASPNSRLLASTLITPRTTSINES
jgi:hypothetical protein